MICGILRNGEVADAQQSHYHLDEWNTAYDRSRATGPLGNRHTVHLRRDQLRMCRTTSPYQRPPRSFRDARYHKYLQHSLTSLRDDMVRSGRLRPSGRTPRPSKLSRAIPQREATIRRTPASRHRATDSRWGPHSGGARRHTQRNRRSQARLITAVPTSAIKLKSHTSEAKVRISARLVGIVRMATGSGGLVAASLQSKRARRRRHAR
ncbi:hypothetical protein FKP32DRAFT_1430904 [Trametes sanguinea]|nr:hypothetical protein FKP32DRAFT_1430904 [Trametes sanguinea]